MGTVVVSNNNSRVEDAETTTGWVNIGGGGGIAVEPDIVYQNVGAASRKVSTSYIGRGWTDAGSTNLTTTDRRHWLVKITVTNPNALLTRTSPAATIRIGSSASVYYDYFVAGSDNYPPRGGWLLFPLSPNVSGYRDANAGTPTLTAINHYGILGDFSVGSKSENVVMDAIDVGAGLNLVDGTGVSTDGNFQDFVSYDEGTATNRFGYVFTQGSAILVNGRLSIGQTTTPTSTATEFTDSGSVVIWQNGYAETGFHRLLVDLGGTGTEVSISGGTLISEGEKDNSLGLGYVTSEDTRTILEVTGTTGTFTLSSEKITNFQDVILTSSCTITGCDIQTESLTQSGADIENGTVIRTTSSDGYATIVDPTFGSTTGFNNMSFIQEGDGYAVEFTSIGTHTFTSITFTDYGSNGTGTAAILNSSSGLVTVNITGGSTPTYTNTSGSTTSIVVSVQLQLDGLTEGSYGVMIGNGGAEDGNVLLSGYANSSGIISGAFGGTTPQAVIIRARNAGIINAAIQDDGGAFTDFTVDARNFISPGSGATDDVDLLPTSPATSDAFYFGGLAVFEEIELDVSTAGTTYVLTWEYWNGAWTALTVVDTSNSFKTVGWHKINFTGPSDWSTTSVNSQGPFYYVRARVTTGGGTGAVAETITLNDTTKYLPFNSSGTIQSGTGLTSTAVWIEDTNNP